MGHHPGDMAGNAVQIGTGQMSPISWMIIMAIALVAGYFVYWTLFKDSKK